MKRDVTVDVYILTPHELSPDCDGKWWFPGERVYRNPLDPRRFGDRSFFVARCNGSADGTCPAKAIIDDRPLEQMLLAESKVTV